MCLQGSAGVSRPLTRRRAGWARSPFRPENEGGLPQRLARLWKQGGTLRLHPTALRWRPASLPAMQRGLSTLRPRSRFLAAAVVAAVGLASAFAPMPATAAPGALTRLWFCCLAGTAAKCEGPIFCEQGKSLPGPYQPPRTSDQVEPASNQHRQCHHQPGIYTQESTTICGLRRTGSSQR